MFKQERALIFVLCLITASLAGCGGGSMSQSSPPPNPQPFQLSVQIAGTGTGTVSSTPSGINCGSACKADFDDGTSVTLTPTATNGSTFAGWGGACSGTSSCKVTISANTSVTATFNQAAPPPTSTLTVDLAGNGSGSVTSSPAGISCGTQCSATYDNGTQVTLTATPVSGSTFTGWGGACTGTAPCIITLNANTSVTATFSLNAVALTVTLAGTGSGTVTSSPAGINCGTTCSAPFDSGTQVTLTATPAQGSTFAGWTGGSCSSNPSCVLTLTANAQVTATFNTSSNISALNHIVFLAQENRSFDHYFGALREYWAQNGYPDQSFDGLPQFNPASGQPPLYGPPPAIPGCDPADPPPSDCVWDPQNLVASYHLITQCIENPSPSWNESHVDWDYEDQLGKQPATLNGFVHTAAHDARTSNPPFNDVNGIRAMGYYDWTDLNYYYFMASNFGTSDRFFNAAMTRTHPNRMYLIAGTSQGYAYPVGTNANDQKLLTATTIFQELQNAGITWKIYVDPEGSHCSGPPYDPHCLKNLSYIQNFQWGQTVPDLYPNNIAPISQYFTDLQNGTLPQVAQIEPATDAGFDEHPTVNDNAANDIQRGANYVSSLINGLMTSSSWKDSAFILTYDEGGGLYDHVSPQPTVSPDGIPPVDLQPGDLCTKGTGPTCDFVYTGYRVPLIVVSPYAKKNYVSHTVADFTAILKLIETRFALSSLTARDAAQMDMTEFFDFTNPVWLTPPSPPTQNLNGACYLNHLP